MVMAGHAQGVTWRTVACGAMNAELNSDTTPIPIPSQRLCGIQRPCLHAQRKVGAFLHWHGVFVESVGIACGLLMRFQERIPSCESSRRQTWDDASPLYNACVYYFVHLYVYLLSCRLG